MCQYIPKPIRSVLLDLFNRGLVLKLNEPQWTTPLCRHVGCNVEWQDGSKAFVKLAIASEPDLDEPNRLNGMRREVWWSRVIQKLNERDASFPFKSPLVLATNVDEAVPFFDDVAWVALEEINGKPIVNWDISSPNHDMDVDANLDQFFDTAASVLHALESIHPDTLDKIGMPPLPAPPHGMRRYQKRMDLSAMVLGNGAFEVGNFWHTTDGSCVLMDNEFAGWYPKHDHLTYLFHRLYCNAMRPDLANKVLNQYRTRFIQPNQDAQFLADFCSILRPRVLGGWLLDTTRRKLPPWHRKQRLRYKLLWDLWNRRVAH